MLKRGEGIYLGFENKERYFLASILGLITIIVMGIFAYANDEALPNYAFKNPVAYPGHARVIEVGLAITLDGTGSISPAGAALSYNWTLIRKPDGSLAKLNNANTPRPSLLPDIDGDYRVELIVADENGKSSPAQTVLLSTRNIPPVAMGGADRVTRLGQSVRFDPQGTYDANGDRLTAEWSILSYLPFDSLLSDEPDELEEATTINLLCPVNTLESQGVFHAISVASGQQSPQLAVGVPLAEGTVETGNLSATTYFGPVTMDLTGNASVLVPEGEILQIVLSSAWNRSARAEILISTDGETYTSLGTVGEGGSVYGAYDSNVLRYDDFTVPAGGARFLQVLQQRGGVRVDGVIYETQCQSDGQGPNVPDVDNFSDAATLLEDEDGRFVFIPKLAGQFEVQLTVEDSDGASSIDIVNVYVAPTDNLVQSPKSDPNFNIRPIADAGRSQLITLGQTVTLDGSQSTDINGELLAYKWSVLSKPAESSSVLENVSGPITSFTPDAGHLYVIQLAVTDTHNKTDYDTVVLSSDFISPVAISGSSIEGANGAINNQTASVDGGMSRSSQGTNFNIFYDWSLLGLSAGNGVFDGSSRATTGIDFQSLEDQERLRRHSEATIALLAEYNLIVFEDLDTNVDTWGPALVGGDLLGASGTFGTRIPQGQNIDAVTVGGDITGGPKNINNGGNVRHGGAVSTHVNLNGGGQLINDEDIDITSERSGLINLSAQLASLPSNSIADIPNPNGQNGPAHLNANPDTNGVAIFELLDGNILFNNDRVQQIEINANGAESIIVNIGGQDIDFSKGNFVGLSAMTT